jgi:hypothetical protein
MSHLYILALSISPAYYILTYSYTIIITHLGGFYILYFYEKKEKRRIKGTKIKHKKSKKLGAKKDPHTFV